MFECERCGDGVECALRHREYGVAVTHRVSQWLCRDCHPTAPDRRSGSRTRRREAEAVVTDGGTVTACPRCAAATVNVHGITDCVECEWNHS
jgi:transposase-like protein